MATQNSFQIKKQNTNASRTKTQNSVMKNPQQTKTQKQLPKLQNETLYGRSDLSTAAQTDSFQSYKKNLPKGILGELNKNDKDFWDSLQHKGNRKTLTAEAVLKKSQMQGKNKIIGKKIDQVLYSVANSVDLLRNNLKQEKNQTNNISESDSDEIQGSSQNDRKKKNYNIGKKFGSTQLPDPDKSLSGYSKQLKAYSAIDNDMKYTNNRQDQIEGIQNNLGDSIQKFNVLKRDNNQKQEKLRSLLIRIDETENELHKMDMYKQMISGDGNQLTGKISSKESELSEIRGYTESLKFMKTRRRKDLDLAKKRCDENKQLNKQFKSHLKKEQDNLVVEARDLDEIRIKIQKVQDQKEKFEFEVQKIVLSQENIRKEEEDIIQMIQKEQHDQQMLNQIKKEEQVMKKKQNQQALDQQQADMNHNKQVLLDLEAEFQKYQSKLKGIHNIDDLLIQLNDLREANESCLATKEKVLLQMNNTRKNIEEKSTILKFSQYGSVSLPQNDEELKEYAQTTLENTEKEHQQLEYQIDKAKESEQFLQKTLNKVERGLANILVLLKNSKIPEMKVKQDFEGMELLEKSTEVMNNLQQLYISVNLENTDEQKLQEILVQKYKEYDDDDKSFEEVNDIEEMNSESSYDNNNSQVENTV